MALFESWQTIICGFQYNQLPNLSTLVYMPGKYIQIEEYYLVKENQRNGLA